MYRWRSCCGDPFAVVFDGVGGVLGLGLMLACSSYPLVLGMGLFVVVLDIGGVGIGVGVCAVVDPFVVVLDSVGIIH